MIDYVSFLLRIADLSDPIALKFYNADELGVEIKANETPVSAGDLAIENEIRRLVGKEMPNLSIVGEEYGLTQGDSNVKLIIDPIDGTKNFIKGIPFFATLLAIEEDGEVVAGLVSAPANNDRWWAQKGQGAFHNGKQIKVSDVARVEDCLAVHGSIFGSEASDDPQKVLNLLSRTYRQRGFGDYYPAMLVAMGLADFAIDFKLKEWDIASLKIIVEEAGGQFSDTAGQDNIYSGNFVVSNGKLHADVVNALDGLT